MHEEKDVNDSVLPLLEIAESLRLLGPSLHRLATTTDYSFLPTQLSPIAPAVVWGDHETAFPEIRKLLEKDQEWRTYSEVITHCYQQYKSTSKNELIWLGCNYWNPRKPDGEQRTIQVAMSGSQAIAETSGNEQPFLDSESFKLSHSDLSTAGREKRRHERGSLEPLFSENPTILKARDLGEGTWKIFTRSVEHFRDRQLMTIGDYIHRDFYKSFETAARPHENLLAPIAPMAVHFADVRAEELGLTMPFVRTLTVPPNKLGELWDWVISQKPLSSKKRRPNPGRNPLVEAWINCANCFDTQERIPSAVDDCVDATVAAFRVENRTEGYVLLQHLAWFEKALQTPYVYALPISFGQYFAVMIMGMRSPLRRMELTAWHQIGVQLFGSVLVGHLAQIHTDLVLREREDQQRKLLSHSIPKFVFKPAEYFSVRIQSEAGRSAAADMQMIKNFGRLATFALSRGQQILTDFTQAVEDTTVANSVNLCDVCQRLTQDFESLAEFFISGRVDSGIRRSDSLPPFREELLRSVRDHKVITLTTNVPEDVNIRCNSGVLTSHCWNLIDNSFRHIDYSKAFVNGSSDHLPTLMEIALGIFPSEDKESVEFYVRIKGNSIADPERLRALERVFRFDISDSELSQTMMEIRGWKNEEDSTTGLESENKGGRPYTVR